MANVKANKPHTPTKAGRFLKRFGIVLGSLLLVFVTTCAIVACYAAVYVKNVIMPEVEQSSATLVTSNTDLTSNIYYYDTEQDTYVISQPLYASENRVWADLKDMPDDLINATIAIEDKRFLEHHGVDWLRTAAAVKYMFTGQQIQGGSTITQQLIKNLTGNDETTVRRKVLEIFEALEFNKTHSKEETIEWYLNVIYLGHGCYGVSTAAQKYFGKSVSELSLAECASLISITNNPALYDPYTQPENNKERRDLALDLMCQQGYISEETRDSAQAEEVKCVFGSEDNKTASAGSDSEYYSWYTDAVIESVIDDLAETYGYDETTATNLIYSGGLQIYSCLDPEVQEKVDAIYGDASSTAQYQSAGGQTLRSGITVVDNNTGAVVALAGGVGEKKGNRIWNCATDTLRPPGSSIKPLAVYAPALESGLILPSSGRDDTPFQENSDGTLWPVNDEGYYSGLTDIDTAMTHSLNTIAVKVLSEVGLENSYNFLTNEFGITTLVQDYETSTGVVRSDLNYAPLALGGLTKGVSTLEMAAAYATFPRDGSYSSPYLYTVVTDSNGKILLSNGDYSVKLDDNGNVYAITGNADSKTILRQDTAYYMNLMLQHVVTDGTGKLAKLSNMTAAGKTGTTTNDYDRWFVGYTPYYTAAVWTGYDRQERINSVGNPSCVLWQKVMSAVSEGDEDIGFNDALETTQAYCCTSSGLLATSACSAAGCGKTQTFLPSDVPTEYCNLHYYSNGNMILNYQRSGAAAKASIRGEVSYIPKKVTKPKVEETPEETPVKEEDDAEDDQKDEDQKESEEHEEHHEEEDDDD